MKKHPFELTDVRIASWSNGEVTHEQRLKDVPFFVADEESGETITLPEMPSLTFEFKSVDRRSYRQLMRVMTGISCPSCLRRWLRQAREEN